MNILDLTETQKEAYDERVAIVMEGATDIPEGERYAVALQLAEEQVKWENK